jgi:hypothetical protein
MKTYRATNKITGFHTDFVMKNKRQVEKYITNAGLLVKDFVIETL